MSSRRVQIRALYQSIPASHLAGTTLDDLISRCESHVAAIDVWASKGNARAVKQTGSGLVAICAWKAANELAEGARMEHFQRASGISPAQFNASDKELTTAIREAEARKSSTSNPSTPRHDRLARPGNMSILSSPSTPSKRQVQTPEEKLKHMRDVMSGAAFAKSSTSSPLSRSSSSSRVRIRDESDAHEDPQTPTKRILRDRSTIRETKVFDPSEVDLTPTKSVPRSMTKSTHTPSQSGTPGRQATRVSAAVSPSKNISATKRAKKRDTFLVGYPLGEPLWVAGAQITGEWDGRRAGDRLRRCIAALDQWQELSEEEKSWGRDEIFYGHLRLTR